MVNVHDAELVHVGCDAVELAFVTAESTSVQVQIGDRVVESSGLFHVVRVEGLEPETGYLLRVAGVEPSDELPAAITTLSRPTGTRLTTIAVVNDVHFGETVCGELAPEHDVQPVFRAEPGDPPYPEVMNAAVVDEILRREPQAVIANGDLTDHGSSGDYQRFLDVYGGAFGDRLHHVRGNHDGMEGDALASGNAPSKIALDGVTLAIIDTVVPGAAGGHIDDATIEFLRELGASASQPVLVFGHHPTFDPVWDEGREQPFNLSRADTERLVGVLDEHPAFSALYGGHTHRNLVRRSPSRHVPLVEVAAVKEYPGAWAEVTVYEGGYTHVVHRVGEARAMAWAEKTSHMVFGLHRGYARGSLTDRCFSRGW